jgi:pyruvate dehydrogenase E1 component alpha subunit
MASSAVVASVIPAAVGMAFANKQQSNGRVSCVFFGDGAVEEGVFWESLNVACVMKLPVLFVCEDNGLAQHTSSHVRHGYPSITRIVSEFDCNSIEEDSTDVTRIYSLAKEAIALTRSTQKPSFLQLHCYRYLEHVGIYEDFNAGYRSREDYETYLEKDCLKLQRKRLVTEGFSASEVERVESAIEQQIQASLRLARQAPFPDAQEVYYGVFHEAN